MVALDVAIARVHARLYADLKSQNVKILGGFAGAAAMGLTAVGGRCTVRA